MSKPEMVIWIMVVAVISAGLYVWGLKKSMTQEETLMLHLYQKGTSKVLKYLKKNGQITEKEVRELVKDLKASEFYSRKKAVVTNLNEFTRKLLEEMEKEKLIQAEKRNHTYVYKLYPEKAE